jgi:hypothetical protein
LWTQLWSLWHRQSNVTIVNDGKKDTGWPAGREFPGTPKPSDDHLTSDEQGSSRTALYEPSNPYQT